MIVFEERLEEIVNVLPPVLDELEQSRPIKYDWGTVETLNKFLLLAGNRAYPLIWGLTGNDVNDLRQDTVTRKARLIIATQSYHVDQFNRFQYKNDFKNVLQPILDNLLFAFTQSGICRYDDTTVQTSRHPNYSVVYREDKDDKTKTHQIGIWNAIAVDVELTFTGDCLKTIYFNN